MPKNIVWASIASTAFIAISAVESLAGRQEVALVTAVNAVAFALLSLRDN